MIVFDFVIMGIVFVLMLYVMFSYNRIQKSRLIQRSRLKMLEMVIFVLFVHILVLILGIFYRDTQLASIYSHVILVAYLLCLYTMTKGVNKLSYQDNKKYIKIEKIMWQILDISHADRVGLVEYHMQFASLTQLVAHNKKYYDIMGQWVNMPMSAITKWRADDGWMEVHNSATHHDREIGTIAQSYDHVSIHHAKIPDIDGYSYGYISMMYCEHLHSVAQDDKDKIDLLCREIAEIIKEDKFNNNIAMLLRDLQHSYRYKHA